MSIATADQAVNAVAAYLDDAKAANRASCAMVRDWTGLAFSGGELRRFSFSCPTGSKARHKVMKEYHQVDVKDLTQRWATGYKEGNTVVVVGSDSEMREMMRKKMESPV